MPYNIVPLDAPSSVANIIGFFPEVLFFIPVSLV
jgi:callose synthase